MGNGLFQRVVANESGIQLNPPKDDSLGIGSSNTDLTAGAMIICKRGRVDKPFWVYKNTWRNRTGHPEPLRASINNEYALHFQEAFRDGTQAILVQRIGYLPSNTEGAPAFKNDYVIIAAKLPTLSVPKPEVMVFVQDTLPTDTVSLPATITSPNSPNPFEGDFAAWAAHGVASFYITINGTFIQLRPADLDFSGVTSMADVVNTLEAAINTPTPIIDITFDVDDGFTFTTLLTGEDASIEFSYPDLSTQINELLGFAGNEVANGSGAATDLPNGYKMVAAYKMKDYILDGYSVQVHLDTFNDAAVTADSVRLSISIIDNVDLSTLYAISGAITTTSMDDGGNTRYIGDLAELYNDVFDFYEGDYPLVNMPSLGETLNASFDVNGRPIYYELSVTPTTIVNPTPFGDVDFEWSHLKLLDTTEQFEYLMGAGTRSIALIERLVLIMKERGVVFNFDVPSEFDIDQAVAWVGQFSIDPKYVHLARCLYAPIKARNSLTSGMSFWGSSAVLTGLSCARNAVKNGFGFPPMNVPIAGEQARLGRSLMRQTVIVNDVAKRKLAKARIIPVIFEVYESGNFVVFFDSLSMNPKDNSFLKLSSVGEMSNYLDKRIATRAKSSLQKPMSVAIEEVSAFIDGLLENAESSKWLQKSAELGGNAYEYTVYASIANPQDEMIIEYSACFDGVNRKTTITQTVKRP